MADERDNQPIKVLLVEDEENGYILTRRLLSGAESLRFVLDWVNDYDDALTAIERDGHDVYLLDYQLGARNGLELLAEALSRGCVAPLILLTGHGDPATVVKAMKAGAADYLVKGQISSDILERSIRFAIERKLSEEALRESEARFRAIFEGSSIGIRLLDSSGRIVASNLAFQRLIDYSGDELRQMVFTDYTHPDDAVAGLELFHELMAGKREKYQIDTRYIRKDGEVIWVRLLVSAVRARSSEPRLAIGMVEDSTQSMAVERHKSESLLASQIQQKLFPSSMPVLSGFDIGGGCFPADATGGDFFDFIPMRDEALGFVIGDVSGHGFGPALLMAATRAYLRALTLTHDDVGEILTLANKHLSEDTSFDNFVTLFFARLDPRTRSFVYASAGHPTGYVLDSSGSIKRRLESTDVPLAVLLDRTYHASNTITLEPGDLVFVLTDGIEEAFSEEDPILFGAARALEIVQLYRADTSRRIVHNLFHAVRAFSQYTPQLDDITAVVIKVNA